MNVIKKILLIILMLLTININATELNLNENIISNETDSNIELNKETNIKYRNPNTNYVVVIDDSANLIDENKVDSLVEIMKKSTESGNIVFKSTNNNNENNSYYYSGNYYFNLFGNNNGTLLLIDMDNREIFIYSAGKNYNIITTSKADTIADNIYKYASDGDYYTCSYKAFEQINKLLSGKKVYGAMKYISNAIIALMVSFITSFIIVLSNSKTKKAKTKELLKTCNVEVQANNINGKVTGTHRKYNPKSSGSSGSHSSGGGHSFSGGGGGHRF